MDLDKLRQEAIDTKNRKMDNLREINALKANIQKLIDGGIQQQRSSQNIPEPQNAGTSHTTAESQPLYFSKVVSEGDRRINVNIPENKASTPEGKTLARVKSYNVDETREFMKKQKEKRFEMLKSKVKSSNLNNDLKKQKLQELDKKSRELVAKNVEANKGRSRSVDNKKNYLRPDYTSGNKSRSASRDRSNSRERHLISKNNDPVFPSSSRSNSREKHVISRNNDPVFPSSSKIPLLPPKVGNISNITLRSPRKISQIDNDTPEEHDANQALETNKSQQIINIQEYLFKKPLKNETKETQTGYEQPKKNYPDWLNEQPQVSPYNFMNTVKRKLQNVLSNPQYADVGTQMNTPPLLQHAQETLSKNGQRSQTFLKLDPRPVKNLLLQVPNREILNKNIRIPSCDKTATQSESGSDTSKNIPDISSESGTSLKKNAESVKLSNKPIDYNLQLSTANLKEMRLSSEIKLSSGLETIQSVSMAPTTNGYKETMQSKISKNLFCSKASYTSDYNTETDLGSSIQEVKSSRSPRDSIISSNRCLHPKPNKKIVLHSNTESTCGSSVQEVKSSRSPRDSIISSNKSLHTKPNKKIVSHSNTESTLGSSIQELKSSRSPRDSIISSNRILRPKPNKKIVSHSNTESTLGSSIQEEKSSRSPKDSIISYHDLSLQPKPHKKVGSHSKDSKIIPEISKHSSNNQKEGINSLQEPQVSLKISNLGDSDKPRLSIVPSDIGLAEKSNQIHLRFEAEIHLLNDFNKSIHQFSAVEKAFESLKNNEISSILNTSKQKVSPALSETKDDSRVLSQINFSRGSEHSILTNGTLHDLDMSSLSGLGLPNYTSVCESVDESQVEVSVINNYDLMNPAGMSLKLLEQLIKDEDSRIKNLKTMLKIRDKSLRDRVMTELSALEVQRRTLCQTGKLQEASAVKKKQRGIILKLSEEKHEMQRLRQLHKAKSKERISKLQEERNLIKAQLSTDKMLSKIKLNTPRDRKLHGPLRVVSHSESIVSETSVSRKSSVGEDVVSVSSSRRSVTSVLSEVESNLDIPHQKEKNKTDLHISQMKRALLMREASLEKRKKETEKLLQWHRKLVEDEKRIKELEIAANAVVSQTPKDLGKTEVTNYEGSFLNELWYNITGCKTTKFADNKIYVMSQLALKKFCRNASEYTTQKHKNVNKTILNDDVNSSVSKVEFNIGDLLSESIPKKSSASVSLSSEKDKSLESTQDENKNCENVPTTQESSVYTPDFDVESVKEIASVKNIEVVPERSTISSISDLIDNFNKIDEEMSVMSKESQKLLNESNKLLSEVEESEISFETSWIEENHLNFNVQEESDKSVQSEHVTDTNKDLIGTKTETNSTTSLKSILEVDNDQKDIVTTADLSTQLSDVHDKQDPSFQRESLSVQTADVEDLIDHSQTIQSHLEENKSESEILDLSLQEPKSESRESQQETIVPSPVLEEEIQSVTQVSHRRDMQFKVDEKELPTVENEIESILDDINQNTEDDVSPLKSKETDSIEEKEHDSLSELSQVTIPSEDSFRTQLSSSNLKKLNEDDSSKTKTPSDTTLKTSPESMKVKEKESSDTSLHVHSSETSEIPSEVTITSKSSEKKSSRGSPIDVKKRVSEIMADANTYSPRGDKSPRMQDLYITTYDVTSPGHSPELGSPIDEDLSSKNFGTESEELLKKQLAIEQEIKQLEQQQKELPYVLMREIPNKPPPPYTPPSSTAVVPVKTVLPNSTEEIDEITKYSAKIIYKAYLNNNLDNISISENTLSLITKNNISKDCYKYVFDICKEIAKEHYKQFKQENDPVWLTVSKKPQLAPVTPLELNGLEKVMNGKLKELFNFKKPDIRENTIIKWSRKKRDHVDEILVLESQAEEADWTYYDKDELTVMDNVTNDIMNMLLADTVDAFTKMWKKSPLC